MRCALLFAWLIAGLVHSRAQERCAAHDLAKRWMHEHHRSGSLVEALRHSLLVSRGGTQGTITVVFHVVYDSPAENVAAQVIMETLATLNADFQAMNDDFDDVRAPFLGDRGNPAITFCLATTDPQGNLTTGITRTPTTITWFDPQSIPDAMKSAPYGIAPWDPQHYLNIWICDISSGLGGGLVTAGYAYPPLEGVVGSGIDGIVLDQNHGVGDARTVTHEAAHYLGLIHPWGDGGCASDDGMADTPTTDDATFSCANTALMNCGFLTQYENFMDYAPCAVMFTLDQSAYMNVILGGIRISLVEQNNCGSDGVSTRTDGPFVRSYPQPADGSLTVDTRHPCSLVLVDVAGCVRLSTPIGSSRITLNTSDLASGWYSLRCTEATRTAAQPILVLH